MGMSTCVVGIIPKDDDEFKRMTSILTNCIVQEIAPPKEVLDYFNIDLGEDDYLCDCEEVLDEKGVIVEDSLIKAAVEAYSGEMESGYDIDIRKLPSNVKIIRVYNSW